MSYPGSFGSGGEPTVQSGAVPTKARSSSMNWPNFLVGQDEKPVRVILIDDDEHMQRVVAQELMEDARTLLVGMALQREGRASAHQAA